MQLKIERLLFFQNFPKSKKLSEKIDHAAAFFHNKKKGSPRGSESAQFPTRANEIAPAGIGWQRHVGTRYDANFRSAVMCGSAAKDSSQFPKLQERPSCSCFLRKNALQEKEKKKPSDPNICVCLSQFPIFVLM